MSCPVFDWRDPTADVTAAVFGFGWKFSTVLIYGNIRFSIGVILQGT